eukprot:11441259-Prorocentrum_lima.AAC.1
MLLRVETARKTKRTLNFQKLARQKRMSFMLLHIIGMNQMNLVSGTTKTLKDMMMMTQAVKKRAMGLNQK